LLLADPRVDPAAGNNFAIRYASRFGSDGAVKLLLADPRVDPTADNNYAIRHASDNGHAGVVKLLLADWRVDPSMGDPSALENASGQGHIGICANVTGTPLVVVTKAALVAADQRHHVSNTPIAH
jgi:hypothetical protein